MSAVLARASATAFIVYIGGAGLSYCAQLVIARAVGADGYGQYAYVFAWATTLAYLAALGFDVGLLRFVSAYRAQSEWGLLRGVIQFAERWVIGFGLILALACLAFAELWPQERPAELTKMFAIGCWLIPILALLWVRSSSVRAFGGVLSALGPDRMVRDGVLACAVGVAVFVLHRPISPAWVMTATVVGAALGLSLVTLAQRRWVPDAVRTAVPQRAASLWAQAALPLLTLGVVEAAMNRTGVVVLGWAGMTRDAGVFAMAANVAFLTVLPRTAINALFAPAIAALYARRDPAGLQDLATKTSLWTLAGAVCIALPLGIVAEPILRWFGPEFVTGATALRLMLFAQVLTAAAGSQLYLMTMTGHERYAAAVLVVGAGGNLALSTLLIHGFGITGAALAASASLLIWNCAMAMLIWRFLRLLPGPVAALLYPSRRRANVQTPRGMAGRWLVRALFAAALLLAPDGRANEKLASARFVPTPPMAKPDLLQPTTDPALGEKFVRVTEVGRPVSPELTCGDAYCTHRYSSAQAWNADQSLLSIVEGCSGACFLDGQTYKPLFHRPLQGECEWHPTNPLLMICVAADQIYTWAPRADTKTIIYAPTDYKQLQFGPYKGNPSLDGSKLAVRAVDADGAPVAFVYDIVAGKKYPDIKLAGLTGKTVFCSVSASGQYVFCFQELPDETNVAYVFTATGEQVQYWPENHRPGHGDMTIDADGSDVYVGVSKSDPDKYHIIKRRLSDGRVTDLAPFGEGQHVSMRNINLPGWAFVTYTGTSDELAQHPDWAPFYQEVVALRIDGSGELRRIVQTRAGKGDYWNEAHASPSPDGTQVIWSSNWDTAGGPVEDYVARLSWPAHAAEARSVPTAPAPNGSLPAALHFPHPGPGRASPRWPTAAGAQR